MEEGNFKQASKSDEHASGIERGVYSIFHIQALGRAAVVL
jgi:hypothetical protein